jgi:choloylglycine hydrolase
VGKNYDWDVENGRIFINKRNVQKVAFKVDNPVSWTSKYGSITFNQYGQDFPIGGMNEKGLVIEALWLNETVYPQPDGTRQNIDNMQWIQFHLDNSYDINDVIKNDSSIQFSPTSASAVHCFITDKFGKSLIFESVNGTTYHFKTDNNNFPFLTNDSYEKSVRMINRCKLFGGNLDIPEGNGSITRFIHIGIALKNYNRGNANPIDYSFNILKNVSMGNYTKWTIVYDLNNLSISYRTKTSRGLKIIKMNSFNLNCSDETISINIINNYKEDVSKFFIFTPIELNKKMVLESFRNTPFLMNIKPEYVEAIYKYPSNFKCK